MSETYRYNPTDYNQRGLRKSDLKSFRDVVKDMEEDFHALHPSDYAWNLYGNSKVMRLLEKACGANSKFSYGMELTKGRQFHPIFDPRANFQMGLFSELITVYGIDSAYMTKKNEYGYPIINEEKGIFPLTLLIDDDMEDGVVRLAKPIFDDGDDDEVDIPIDVKELSLV